MLHPSIPTGQLPPFYLTNPKTSRTKLGKKSQWQSLAHLLLYPSQMGRLSQNKKMAELKFAECKSNERG
jgi:hypothetical protein